MFNFIKKTITNRVIWGLLLVFVAGLLTTGGIGYYRYKAINQMLQNPAYQTAAGIINLERYNGLALSKDQALKLLPIARELANQGKGVTVDNTKQVAAMQEILTAEQRDFVKNQNQNIKGYFGKARGMKITKPNNVIDKSIPPSFTASNMSLTEEEKGLLVPILKELTSKPNSDETYLTQKATEIKAVLTAAGIQKGFVEPQYRNNKASRVMSGERGKNQKRNDKKEGRAQFGEWGHGNGFRGTNVYNDLTEIIMQKAYN